tara:strand:+ start:88 stop:489 length:402 start_codon:yes stop_codon:yes gene_type:complete
MKKIEHIGIAVKSIEEANKTFAKIFGKEHYKIEEVKSEGVKTSFFSVGESKIELLEAKNQESPIAKFISKRGEGMHHIAFYVDDIEKEMERLKENGFQFIRGNYTKGADNKLICFLHPKQTNGVLIELCQEQP